MLDGLSEINDPPRILALLDAFYKPLGTLFDERMVQLQPAYDVKPVFFLVYEILPLRSECSSPNTSPDVVLVLGLDEKETAALRATRCIGVTLFESSS